MSLSDFMPPTFDAAVDRREVFCRAYVRDLNATRAYAEAFPNPDRSPESTQTAASKLRAEPCVANRIEELLRERYASMDLKIEQLIRALVNVAFMDVGDMFDDRGQLKAMSEMPEYVRRAIESFEVEETVRLEKTHGIDPDTGEVKLSVEPYRVTVKKVKLASRLGALQILAKHQALLHERGRLTVEDGAMDGMDDTALAARIAGILEAARRRREALKSGEDLV